MEGESICSNIPITKHVKLMVDVEKKRIISMIEKLYFFLIHDFSLEMYKSICDLYRYKCITNMPLTNEYSVCTNTSSGKQFICASKEEYLNKLKGIFYTTYFTILVDENIDQIIGHHLMVILHI